jgi:two-component system response regulator FixJ
MPPDSMVHVIDDDEAMRDSLAFLFKSAKVAVAAYDSADGFLAKLPAITGGCVVTDVRMPGMNGLDLLKRLRELKSALPVIVITGHADVPLAVDAMKHGAADFLEKPFDDDVLLAAVRRALAQDQSSKDDQTFLNSVRQRLTLLSTRERQVLEGLIAGKANKVIGFDLDISPRTIEIYRANVMTKMAASSLSELVRMALMAGVTGPR